MEEVSEKSEFDETDSLQKYVGVRVISPNGAVLGRVREVRSDARVASVLGIVVSRSFFRPLLYIGREYLDRFSKEAIVLKVEPSVLLKGMKVISSEGEHLGRVREVVRVKKSNGIDYLTVKQLFRKEFNIKPSAVESYGKALLLKEGVDVPKRSFWS